MHYLRLLNTDHEIYIDSVEKTSTHVSDSVFTFSIQMTQNSLEHEDPWIKELNFYDQLCRNQQELTTTLIKQEYLTSEILDRQYRISKKVLLHQIRLNKEKGNEKGVSSVIMTNEDSQALWITY